LNADRQIRSARILALIFCAAGGLAIVAGWNGAARQASPDSQLPYLLSGGAAGIGLLTFGVGLLLVAQIRTERRRLMDLLEVMAVAVGATAGRDDVRAELDPDRVGAPSGEAVEAEGDTLEQRAAV